MGSIAIVSRVNETLTFGVSESGGLGSVEVRAASALWPAPRPETSEWTVSEITPAHSRLVHHSPGGAVSEVPGSRTEPPVLLGPRLGHYANWSPAGDSLCYVVPEGRSLVLNTWTAGEDTSRSLVSAAPLFSSWIPGGSWLACHHGPTLSLFEAQTGEQRVLSTSASGFRTPAASSDGRLLAWAEVRDGRVYVMCSVNFDEPLTLADFGAGVALSFPYGSNDLYAAVGASPEAGVFAEIVALNLLAPGEVHRVVYGPLVAYWWSPAGDRLVTLHPTYSGDGRFQARLYDASGRALAATEGFVPSGDSATVVSFFDQYALSHPSWSSDGVWFGLCGSFVHEGPHRSFSGTNGHRAWLWDTTRWAPLVHVAEAELLAFGRTR